MLKQIGLRNIRIFSDKKWDFDISDISVFCGTNSVGKSTILKIIPLLRQTHGIRESGEPVRGQLRFVGSQVDLGNYTTLTSNRNNGPIEISLLISDNINTNRLEAFDYNQTCRDLLGDFKSQNIDKINVDIECSFKFICDAKQHTSNEELNQIENNSADNIFDARPDWLDRAIFTVKYKQINLFRWSISRKLENDKIEYFIHFPEKYFNNIGGASMMEPSQSALPNDEPSDSISLDVVLRGLLPASIIAQRRQKKSRSTNRTQHKTKTWGVFPLPYNIEEFTNSIFSTLSNFHYIAPLRSPAKRYYITNTDNEPTMDPAGEFLPHLLKNNNHLKKKVSYCSPLPGSKNTTESLLAGLSKWINYLKTGSIETFDQNCKDFQISTTKGILVELSLKSENTNQHYSLADSGFGYSQVLPIIAVCLLAKTGATIAIEQPELHLNPALQVRIAQFFVSMAKSDKRILIETHSEHIVNALRVFYAENIETDSFPNISLKYLDNSRGAIEIHDLNISNNGSVQNWPKSFFGEALDLSTRLIKAQTRKKTAQRV